MNRSLDLGAGSFIYLRGTADQRIQRRGDDLFGRDVVNEEQHPGPQRTDRGKFLGNPPLCSSYFFYLGPIDRLEKRIARRKMAVQSSRPNPSLCGDVVQAGICARPGERLLGYFQNAFSVTLRIGAQLTPGRL